ncbi:unnamed protein product [Nezara viridula]|uniref:Uncharacterized protein n=1 Tax=Nezara viridula TaxID=85310 RepID=A0A9P0E4Z5_NEZVI|nr:unnamed protein product [Nezara viridula]
MALTLPPIPQSLKTIQHYLKTASEHEGRDPIVTYWCRLYALQNALKIDKKSEDARILLVALMDWLEKQKQLLSDNEAITNDVAAQAHLENYALKLFTWADSQDRAAVFNKNVVKAFYTAGMLMDVLTTFGEHTDEIARNCKYAKWKAAYIHNCLKNGETPIPGPMDSDKENDFLNNFTDNAPQPNIGFQVPPSNFTQNISGPSIPPAKPENVSPQNITPAPQFNTNFTSYPSQDTTSVTSNAKLDPALTAKAQKYCKFAGSALNYDDIPEAINNLEKALRLLKTGQDT